MLHTNESLRFALLHHTDWSEHPDHYDLLLQKTLGENDDSRVLATYSTQLNRIPCGQGELLHTNCDHRLAYLHLEGVLSQQRGSIRRIDSGWLTWLDPDQCHFQLEGRELTGTFVLKCAPEKQREARDFGIVTFFKK